MSSLNRVILIGRLVAAPEMRYTTSGKAVANFRLAVDLFEACIPLSDAFRDAERDYKKSRRKAGQEVA